MNIPGRHSIFIFFILKRKRGKVNFQRGKVIGRIEGVEGGKIKYLELLNMKYENS